ncbi:hypothetical protein EON67_08530, partial [archaeon]
MCVALSTCRRKQHDMRSLLAARGAAPVAVRPGLARSHAMQLSCALRGCATASAPRLTVAAPSLPLRADASLNIHVPAFSVHPAQFTLQGGARSGAPNSIAL